jgi:DNA ligase-associated metallophosphoesterase
MNLHLMNTPRTAQVAIAGETLVLHPFKAIFWARRKILLIADLHLGKIAHFRKEGLAVPADAIHENWDRLISLLLDFQPERVIFLGDLFHSTLNREWASFCDLIAQFKDTAFELVLGNHDILPVKLYEDAQLKIVHEPYLVGPFCLTHHPVASPTEGYYNLAGHIHPCVYLRGKGRQRLRLPCFYFGAEGGILPAFGTFTGMADVRPEAGAQVFVIAEQSVLKV